MGASFWFQNSESIDLDLAAVFDQFCHCDSRPQRRLQLIGLDLSRSLHQATPDFSLDVFDLLKRLRKMSQRLEVNRNPVNGINFLIDVLILGAVRKAH